MSIQNVDPVETEWSEDVGSPTPIFAIIDLETTGLSADSAVIELGVVHFNYDDLSELERHWLYGLGDQIMTAENRAIHHIDPSQLLEKRTFYWDDLKQNVLKGQEYNLPDSSTKFEFATHFVAHNAAFERKFLDPLLDQIGWLPWMLRPEWICTKKCAMRQWPNTFNSYSNQVLRYALPIPDCTNPRFDPPHRALPDALVTTEILKILLSYQSVDTLVQWTAEPIIFDRLPFGKHKGQLLADVPVDYLHWQLRQTDIDDDLRATVTHELDRRRAALAEVAL